ncbi:putative peptidoglycan lipid II flippase [Evansella caseinilytica]|uniref:Probable lipid II flippase MurJ n=1 Tax=Evansella caseinilytica TaxID=1503961 RepID=A0A1H3ULL1_9BACI|nr:murein biosynthesis integral membrane protein MurJ [Evansella caseinilytica]SDZ63310.1 putative peptidoglycan lipid II flippase [Evansella caseinilytica]
MKKTVLVVMLLTILSKVFGFFRDIILAFFYGVSDISDAYLISMTIPESFLLLIGTGIAISFVPVYSRLEETSGTELADKFTNRTANFIVVVCVAAGITGIVFTTPIVKLFASGFDGETLALSVMFTRISMIGLCFSGIVYIMTAYLQLKNNFVMPALIGLPLNMLIVLFIFLSDKFSLILLPLGFVLAKVAQVLFLAPSMRKQGFCYEWTISLKDAHFKKMFMLSLPIMLGVSVNQLNVLVDRTIASQIAIGGISALNYANNLNLFIQGIFVLSIATVMYPQISKMAAEGNESGLKKSVVEGINSIHLLVIPSTFGLMIFSGPVIELLLGRGAFDDTAITLTSYALFFYAIGMAGFGIREVISRAFYSLEDTKTPMINAAIAMVLNIILNIAFSRYLGIGGLALATSISGIFCALLLLYSLRKKLGPLGLKHIFTVMLKIIFASTVMAVAAAVVHSQLAEITSLYLSLLMAVSVGAGIYLLTIALLKVDTIDAFVSEIKRKYKKAA